MESRRIKHSQKKRIDINLSIIIFICIILILVFAYLSFYSYPNSANEFTQPLISIIQTTSIGYFSLVGGIICFNTSKEFLKKYGIKILGIVQMLIFTIVSTMVLSAFSRALETLNNIDRSFVFTYIMVYISMFFVLMLFCWVSCSVLILLRKILK